MFSYFIDASGRLVRTGLYDRLITIGIDQLQNVPTSIGVATGAVKAKAVLAAVLGGFINTLIIDSALAEALVDETEARSVTPLRVDADAGGAAAAVQSPGVSGAE